MTGEASACDLGHRCRMTHCNGPTPPTQPNRNMTAHGKSGDTFRLAQRLQAHTACHHKFHVAGQIDAVSFVRRTGHKHSSGSTLKNGNLWVYNHGCKDPLCRAWFGPTRQHSPSHHANQHGATGAFELLDQRHKLCRSHPSCPTATIGNPPVDESYLREDSQSPLHREQSAGGVLCRKRLRPDHAE